MIDALSLKRRKSFIGFGLQQRPFLFFQRGLFSDKSWWRSNASEDECIPLMNDFGI